MGMIITKASGETEPFSEQKLRRSLQLAGASAEAAEEVVRHVRGKLSPGISTGKIYRHAFSMLRRKERLSAAKYSLRQAIRDLGPSGHPFEKLTAELLQAEGFSTELNKIIQGKCVSHEVDVIAQKDKRYVMVECKFHNQPNIKSDVKVSLYVEARFEDLLKAWKSMPSHAGKTHEAWLVTNTKLTTDAAKYARCAGMTAIGWRYPRGEGLEIRIARAGLHPVTSLVSLSKGQKRQLVDNGIILCKDLLANPGGLRGAGVGKDKARSVLEEAKALIGGK